MSGCGRLFMVDLFTDTRQSRAVISSRFKGKPNTDDFKGVGEEDRGDAGEGAGDEPSEGYFLSFVLYNH